MANTRTQRQFTAEQIAYTRAKATLDTIQDSVTRCVVAELGPVPDRENREERHAYIYARSDIEELAGLPAAKDREFDASMALINAFLARAITVAEAKGNAQAAHDARYLLAEGPARWMHKRDGLIDMAMKADLLWEG